MNFVRRLYLLLSFLLITAACTPIIVPPTAAPGSTAPAAAGESLENTAWQLVSFGVTGAETPVLPEFPITLMFSADGSLGGSGGCNSYGGEYQTQENTLTLSKIVSTLRACVDEPANQQEQHYLQALEAANQFMLTADHLMLSSTTGDDVLNFTRAVSATPEPDAGTPTAITPTVASTVTTLTATPPTAQPGPAYADQTDPIALLASYIDAINRKEYQRAYAYWESPPNQQTFEQFVQGFADTAEVDLLINPPARQGGAAGSVYASIPTLLIATHTDHIAYTFSGCYIARRSNQGNAPQKNAWQLYRGDLKAAAADANLPALLMQACPDAQAMPDAYNNLSTPVDLLASFVDALNRKDYPRAFGYWETPPNNQTLAQFTQGYADTAAVFSAMHLPLQFDAGAGQQYAGMPVWLVATHSDGTKPNFVGCYVAHRPNPEIEGAPKNGDWHLRSATVSEAPESSDPLDLLKQSCTTQ
ncbi:MAG: META domain-containing protein [Chloroflexi bacterium]|nr:META domain-containing protein [Chloroflexota bacterium]